MKLKPWVGDVVEQLCIAEILNDAPMNSSERLALSGFSHLSGTNLSKRVYDGRKKGLIQKDSLVLSQSGCKTISKLLPAA
jgi:hypothetical protein